MPINTQTLIRILDERGVDIELAAKFSQMSVAKFNSTLNGDNTPTKTQLENLAFKLSVPIYSLFMEKYTPPPSEIMDYRSSKLDFFKYGRDTSKFTSIIKLRNFLADIYIRLDLDAPSNIYEYNSDENPEQFATSISNLLGMDELRATSVDKSDFYKKLRLKVQKLGIFVVQDHYMTDSIDGFALYHQSFTSNLIYINSAKRNNAAKTFTLAHELGHIFGKRSAISNNYEYDNEVEQFCNEFAACLLIPRTELLSEIHKRNYLFTNYDSTLRVSNALSEHFKTSVSAILVRLSRLGYIPDKYVHNFLAGFGKKTYPDGIKDPSFGGKDGPKPGVVDLAYFGERSVYLLTKALEQNVTSKYEVFENTGLSKKRIEGLEIVSKAKSLGDLF